MFILKRWSCTFSPTRLLISSNAGDNDLLVQCFLLLASILLQRFFSVCAAQCNTRLLHSSCQDCEHELRPETLPLPREDDGPLPPFLSSSGHDRTSQASLMHTAPVLSALLVPTRVAIPCKHGLCTSPQRCVIQQMHVQAEAQQPNPPWPGPGSSPVHHHIGFLAHSTGCCRWRRDLARSV